ncbi:FCS-Like Zinc finger 3-like [Primulina huaijiensis]|uniref:FCS-Like Zinc finger 3-like n=1 Tax=Primulina huaijiensis TaxID=1492673 RepID=UPI003CC7935D
MTTGASYFTGWEEEEDYQPHFLDSCSLCNRQLSHNTDIFMYRGNMPFCSQECRQEQIEMEEANERRLKLSSSKRLSKTARQNTEPKQEFDSKKSVRSSTVSAA